MAVHLLCGNWQGVTRSNTQVQLLQLQVFDLLNDILVEKESTDSSICPLLASSTNPSALWNPDLVDVVPGYVADLESPPHVGGRRWLEDCPGRPVTGRLPLGQAGGRVLPGPLPPLGYIP